MKILASVQAAQLLTVKTRVRHVHLQLPDDVKSVKELAKEHARHSETTLEFHKNCCCLVQRQSQWTFCLLHDAHVVQLASPVADNVRQSGV